RRFQHLLPVPDKCVAGAQRRPDRRKGNSLLGGYSRDFSQRGLQILLDIVAERLERRNIDHLDTVFKRARARGPNQVVEAEQKGGQRLPGACRRGDENVASGANLRPPESLRLGRLGETPGEPFLDEGIERDRHWAASSIFAWAHVAFKRHSLVRFVIFRRREGA